MIGTRKMALRRTVGVDVDVEGRPVAGPWRTVPVLGHMAATQVTAAADGRILTLTQYRALLEPSADVRVSDLLLADGGQYRVQTVTPRISLFGGTHHISVELLPADAIPRNTFTEPFGAMY